MPEPLGIDNVFVEVTDLDEGVAWYERAAGLRAKVRTPDMAVLDVGGDVAGVVLVRAGTVTPAKLWFEVADATAVAAELGTTTFPIPTGVTTEIADPWGNGSASPTTLGAPNSPGQSRDPQQLRSDALGRGG